MPGPAAASGLAGTTSSVQVQTALSPNAVFAAFESNLTGSAARPPVGPEPAALEQSLSRQERLGTYEIAAALSQETTAIFQASLTDSTAQALTPASLSVTPPAISLSATPGQPTVRKRLDIASVEGTVNWTAEARIFNGRNWLSVSPENGASAAGDPAGLGVEINISALGSSPGIFQGLIRVTDEATGFVAAVPVAVVLTVQQGRIGLNERSFHFTIAGGGATPEPQTLQIYNQGTGALNWSIPPSAVPEWLNVSPLSGSAGGGTSQASVVELSVNGPDALARSSGVYQTLLPIRAPEASNSPQLVTVTLQRVPGSTPASPGIRPAGLVFVVKEGGAAPPPKSFTVSNRGGGSLNAVFNALTLNGGNWLSVGPGGTIDSATGPLATEVTVDPQNLERGFYRGTIKATFGGGEQLDVSVLLIVTPAPIIEPFSLRPPASLEGCAPDSMELIGETVGNGVIAPVSFPRVLLVSLLDSCGEFVDDATVVASVVTTSGTTTIPMEGLGDGVYSGTWVPDEENPAIPISFTALHPTLLSVSKTFQVSTEPAAEGIQLPVVLTSGVVEGAGFTPNRPLAPGGFISLFGSRFTDGVSAGATQIPLERELAGVRVTIGEVDAPLHFVSPGQINAVLPVEFDPGANVSIVVNSNGVLTAPQSYLVAPAMPGIFLDTAGIPAIRRFVSAGEPSQPVTPENPARIGDILEIFATGLGETDPPVGSGDALATGSTVLNPVTVEIGGLGVPVLYQGLAPGFVGLYQVNVQVTDNIPTGNVQIRIIQNGVVGNPDNPAIITVVGQ